MKTYCLILIFVLISLYSKAQYPFEKYDTIKYRTYENWIKYDWIEKKQTIHHTLTIKDFYKNHDSLTVQLSSFVKNWDSSYIRIFRNKNLEQIIFEPMGFSEENIWTPLIVADFNSDSLLDIKLNISYMGCGLAAMNMRVIYLFQTSDGKFKKISYLDKLEYLNRVERDFDKDGKFEIITMTLHGYEEHNYWTFDVFNYENGTLKNVDDKFEYPLMIQFLIKPNFKVTDKISKTKMKTFKLDLPEKIDIR